MKTINPLAYLAVLAISLSLSAHTLANQDQQGDGRRGPPPEAIKACSGMQSGDSVTFTTPRGDNLTATCQTIQGQLVAVPEGHRKQR